MYCTLVCRFVDKVTHQTTIHVLLCSMSVTLTTLHTDLSNPWSVFCVWDFVDKPYTQITIHGSVLWYVGSGNEITHQTTDPWICTPCIRFVDKVTHRTTDPWILLWYGVCWQTLHADCNPWICTLVCSFVDEVTHQTTDSMDLYSGM